MPRDSKVDYDQVLVILCVIIILVLLLVLTIVLIRRCQRKSESSMWKDFLHEMGYRDQTTRANEKSSIRSHTAVNRYSSGFTSWRASGLWTPGLPSNRGSTPSLVISPPQHDPTNTENATATEIQTSLLHVPLEVLVEEDEEESNSESEHNP